MNHTPEPWIPIFSGRITSNEGLICKCEHNIDQKRIVDCVNACAGMEDPAAEISRLKKIAMLLNSGARIIVVEGDPKEIMADLSGRVNPAMELKNEIRKSALDMALDLGEMELKYLRAEKVDPDFYADPFKEKKYHKPSRPNGK